MRLLIVCLGAILAVAGCATVKPPSADELANADYGREITADEVNRIAKARLIDSLIDPNSLMFYAATKTTKYWATDASGVNYFGYLGCYGYNAKNRMGGYSGKDKECLFIRNGVVLQQYVVSEINGGQLSFTPPAATIKRRIEPSELVPVDAPDTSTQINSIERVVGTKFDPADVDKLKPGISTVSDAKQLLGPTSSESNYANGNTLLQWQFVSATMFGSSGGHLAILFGPDKKMIRVTHKFVKKP